MAEARSADDKALLRKAYSVASQQLREAHRAEFNDLHAAAAKELNVDWEPRLSPEERAAMQIDALLSEFPELKDRFAE